ncbi:MAG: LptE family protein, partial [Phycisphaerales bacterium]|nr:LptE family protein [Phycisphaerales bacterium]
TSVRTVSVPILENDTFHPSIALDLTDALVKEIQRRTPYNVTGEVRADTILSGRIRRVELDQLAKSKLTGLSEEVIVTVTIDFEWTDLRTGRTLVARESYAGQGVFNPSRPVGEPVELGTLAVVQQLARDVVSEMRSAW